METIQFLISRVILSSLEAGNTNHFINLLSINVWVQRKFSLKIILTKLDKTTPMKRSQLSMLMFMSIGQIFHVVKY